jgi:hypothetical protein
MQTSGSRIDDIVRRADDLRSNLIDAVGSVFPNNVAADDATTVQGALLHLRAVIDAFLNQNDADSEITGDQSTE